MVVSKSNFT